MSMLTGAQAAILADLAYDTASASDAQEATWRAKGSLAAAQKKAAQRAKAKGFCESNPLDGFKTDTGFTGKSGGFFLKETSGFGATFEREGLSGKELIVAFRGSQTKFDWVSNANTGMEAGPGGSIVHAGFNRMYNSVQDAVHEAVDRSGAKVLHFVGHSLGGAMATLAMADYGLRDTGAACQLYTFGTPRVGGYGFNSQLRRILTLQTVRRVYSVSDPVPMLPLAPFSHFTTGATGLNMGYSYITARAHDRIQYRNQMPAHGWPAPLPLAVKSDPDYWLGMAEKASGFSALGYHALSMALRGIMLVLNQAGFGLSVGTTILDQLVDAMYQAALLTKKIAETTLRFIQAALRLVGRGAMGAAATLADITRSFLRLVFDLLRRPVESAAQMAIDTLA